MQGSVSAERRDLLAFLVNRVIWVRVVDHDASGQAGPRFKPGPAARFKISPTDEHPVGEIYVSVITYPTMASALVVDGARRWWGETNEHGILQALRPAPGELYRRCPIDPEKFEPISADDLTEY